MSLFIEQRDTFATRLRPRGQQLRKHILGGSAQVDALDYVDKDDFFINIRAEPCVTVLALLFEFLVARETTLEPTDWLRRTLDTQQLCAHEEFGTKCGQLP